MTNRLEGLSPEQIQILAQAAITTGDDALYVDCIDELSNIRVRAAYKQGALDGAEQAIQMYKEEASKIFQEELEKATSKAYNLGVREGQANGEAIVTDNVVDAVRRLQEDYDEDSDTYDALTALLDMIR